MSFDKHWIEQIGSLLKLSRETTESTHPCTRMGRAFRIARAISGVFYLGHWDSEAEWQARIPEFADTILELAESPILQCPSHPLISDKWHNHRAIARELKGARSCVSSRKREGFAKKWSEPILSGLDQAIERYDLAHPIQFEKEKERPNGKRIEIHGQGPTRRLFGSGEYLESVSCGAVVTDDEFIQVKHGGGFDSRAVPQDFKIPGTLVAYLSRGNASEYSLTVMEVFF